MKPKGVDESLKVDQVITQNEIAMKAMKAANFQFVSNLDI